jgi:general secretion pathway protein H
LLRLSLSERRRARDLERGQRGFTLLEIMIVIAIGALIMGSAVRGFRSLAKSDLRASTAHLSGAIRYLFDRASTTGQYHRLVIDINEGRYWAEVSDDKFYIPHDAETEADKRRREQDEAKQDEEQKRKEELKQRSFGDVSTPSSFDMSKLDIGDFHPKRARFAAFKETALKPVQIKGSNVKIAGVYTPRMTDEVTSGRAYIYFFPMGQTEPAIVHMSDAKGETFYSIVVHPITGRVKIYDQYINPPYSERYDDQGNRIEP